MDPLAFLTWQFVMFSLFVAAIMYVLRTIVEYVVPATKTAAVWNSLLLMILPVVLGALMGWGLKAYPYATGLTTVAEHIGYGAVAGLLSTIMFKVIKELLANKIVSTVQGVVNAVNGVTGTATTTVTIGATPPPIAAVGTPDAPIATDENPPAIVQSVKNSINNP